jgi:Glycosyl hydrolases family 18
MQANTLSHRFFLFLAIALPTPLALHAQTVYEGNASANAIEGTAVVESCSGCLDGERVGNIGNGDANYLRIKDISVPTTGTYTVTLYYTEGSDGGTRSFTTQINNVAGPTLSNLTGSSWTSPAAPITFQANFTAGSSNSVGFFNATGPAPNVDHIVVSGGSGTTTTKMVAPYVDMGMGSPYNNVPSMAASAGLKYVTLAFIIANGSSCKAAWDDDTLITSENTYAGYIQSLRNAGGDGIISFGGESGDELADVCTTTSSLEAQYQAVITKYNITRLDFDIEYDDGNAINNTAAIDRRNQVLATLQQSNPNLIVSYTLPVDPSGLEDNAIYVLTSALNHGVNVSTVNIMTMDYGTPGEEGTFVVNSSNNTITQLQQIGMNAKLGITPMIGYNDPTPGDTQTEILSLADAQTVVNYANGNSNVGLISFWALERDQSCPGEGTQDTCSGLSQSAYQFTNIFEQF